MTLVEFLTAQLDADEAAARKRIEDRAIRDWPWVQYFPPFDPARVLADVEAKRAIVALHQPDRQLENWYWSERKCRECGNLWHKWIPDRRPTDIGPEQGCQTLRFLAQPYRDHPDWREEWDG